jgi:aspartate kinase
MRTSGHTVEKIGGTSMRRLGEVLEHVVIGSRSPEEMYGRVFVVSAFSGVTNALLSDKKTGQHGVFERFAAGDPAWENELRRTGALMKEIHHGFAALGLDTVKADAFVDERLSGIRDCLRDMIRIRSYGHLHPDQLLPACRELLSAVGEAHSAAVLTWILESKGVRARLLDLSCWKEDEILALDTVIERAFDGLDLDRELPIVTGYVKCDTGVMTEFNRGYSEYTFSRICVLTRAREGIIHKEYHLCTGDPVLLGPENVRIIGRTNFDIADQMSDMGMEAIHPRASREIKQLDIPLRIRNTFEPDHSGTLITTGYVSPEPRVDLITGREDVIAVEVHDPDMVGREGYDRRLLMAFEDCRVSYLAKSTNANTITHVVPEGSGELAECLQRLEREFPRAQIRSVPVALLAVLGTRLPFPGVLSRAAAALEDAGVDVLAVCQATRRVSLQFVVERGESDRAQKALHRALVEGS